MQQEIETTEKLIIEVEHDIDLEFGKCYTLNELIEFVKDKTPTRLDNIKYRFIEEWDTFTFVVSGERIETDDEFEKRLKVEKERRENLQKKAKKEYAQYLKLKEKFET